MWLGTHRPHKNIQDLAAALGILAKRAIDNQPPPLPRLMIAGAQSPMDQLAIVTLFKQAGYHQPIDFLGYLPPEKLSAYYKSAHIYITTSRLESSNLCIAEAMAHGLPVIASDIPVHHEVGGPTIDYYPLGNGQALAETIRRIVDPTLQRTSAADKTSANRPRESQARIRQRSWKAIATQYLDVIDKGCTINSNGLHL